MTAEERREGGGQEGKEDEKGSMMKNKIKLIERKRVEKRKAEER